MKKTEKIKNGLFMLQQWANQSLSKYGIMIDDFFPSTWADGTAFCALISRYRQDLLDYRSIKIEEKEKNLFKAFESSSKLGIEPILNPKLFSKTNQDMKEDTMTKSLIITFVYQLFTCFSKKKIEELDNDSLKNIFATHFDEINTLKNQISKNIPRSRFGSLVRKSNSSGKLLEDSQLTIKDEVVIPDVQLSKKRGGSAEDISNSPKKKQKSFPNEKKE